MGLFWGPFICPNLDFKITICFDIKRRFLFGVSLTVEIVSGLILHILIF